jgi:flagellar protein FlaI
LQELSRIKGQNINELKKEIERRKAVLDWMQKKKITYFKDVSSLFAEYYKDPKKMLEKLGISKRIKKSKKKTRK